MHPDLSSHLHSPECNALIELLQKCHKENPVRKFAGYCNDQDTVLNACLRKEREENRRLNAAKAEQRRQVIQERMRQSKQEKEQH